MRYQAEYACVSHTGKLRKGNQDNFILLRDYMPYDNKGSGGARGGIVRVSDMPALLGVFDGMGGEERGEMASYLAARAASQADLSGSDALSKLFMRANADICHFAEENDIRTTGTTANLLLLNRDSLQLANLGDSRTYLLDDMGLTQFSEDHVVPIPGYMKPPLLQHLGIPETELRLSPTFVTREPKPGDLYLICSDGLTDMVPLYRIEATLRRVKSPEHAARTLVGQALNAGGADNVTVLVCRIDKAESALPDVLKKLFK